ncbi:MAG: hypothetical protein IPO25_21690 [Saprospiraceae bacterium]|nr:hypothetical protein [Saprospiraceae bacterium]
MQKSGYKVSPVRIAHSNPRRIVRRGLMASSQTLATFDGQEKPDGNGMAERHLAIHVERHCTEGF